MARFVKTIGKMLETIVASVMLVGIVGFFLLDWMFRTLYGNITGDYDSANSFFGGIVGSIKAYSEALDDIR